METPSFTSLNFRYDNEDSDNTYESNIAIA